MKYFIDFTTDIQGNFSGGKSISANYNRLAEQAFEAVSENINSELLKLKIPVYKGLIADNRNKYFLPADVDKMGRVFDSMGRNFRLTPEHALGDNSKHYNLASHIDKGVYGELLLNTSLSCDPDELDIEDTSNPILLENFKDSGVFESDGETASLDFTNRFFINGTEGMRAISTQTTNKIKRNWDEEEEISVEDFADKVINIVFDVDTFEMKPDVKLNFYIDGVVKYSMEKKYAELQHGFNVLTFKIADSTTNTVTTGNINSFDIEFSFTGDKEFRCILENMVMQRETDMFVEYFTNRIFVDKDTLKRKARPDNNQDRLNVDKDTYRAMVVEGSILLGFQQTKRRNHSTEIANFESQLRRIYGSARGDSLRESEGYNYNDN